jgi:hypothetical protein
MPGWHLPTRSRPFLAHDSLRRLAGAWCWRPVSAARRNRPPHLAALCENYWYPLYAFVRRRGHEADEAQDFTQALFAAAFGKERSRRCPSRAWKVSVVPADVGEALPGVGPRTGGETGRRPICAANRLWDCRGAVPCRTEPRPDAREDLRAAWGAGAARMLRVLDCRFLDCRFSSHGLKPVRWQTLDQTKSHFLLCTILGIMSFKNDFMSLAFATESRTPACVADCLHSIHVEAALTSWSSSAVDFSLKSESLPSVIIRSFANCHQ